MQKHAMLISTKATDFINSGQVPVIVGDCPLYAQQKTAYAIYGGLVGSEMCIRDRMKV